MKIINPSHSFLVGIVKVLRSNFKVFKLSIYPNNMFKEDTRIKTALCNEWQKSQHALLIFVFFL